MKQISRKSGVIWESSNQNTEGVIVCDRNNYLFSSLFYLWFSKQKGGFRVVLDITNFPVTKPSCLYSFIRVKRFYQ